MASTVGESFARAIAAKDAQGLLDVLGPTIDFRAMTPGRVWEATSPKELVDDVIFGHWFEETDHIDEVESIENDTIVDRERVGYRFRITNPDGTFEVEQQAYYEVADDKISWLRIACSGYRRITEMATLGD